MKTFNYHYSIAQYNEGGMCIRVDYSKSIRGAKWMATRYLRRTPSSVLSVVRLLDSSRVCHVYFETGMEDVLGRSDNASLMGGDSYREDMGKTCRLCGLTDEEIKTHCSAFAK